MELRQSGVVPPRSGGRSSRSEGGDGGEGGAGGEGSPFEIILDNSWLHFN